MALRGIAQASSLALPSQTFANLPSASSAATNQIYYASDIGQFGSYWASNGTTWTPVNADLALYVDSYPFVMPSSGSITVTTGALLLTTALDVTYANCYMYFPANAWTSSTAGFYYVAMTSTTAGTVYSNAYTSGVPTTPASPSVVTTGAGAYTQTTGSYVAGQSFSIPGNIMGTNGRLAVEFLCIVNNTANTKVQNIAWGGSGIGGFGLASSSALAYFAYITNQNATGTQSCLSINSSHIPTGTVLSKDTTSAQTIQPEYQLTTATDWMVSKGIMIRLTR